MGGTDRPVLVLSRRDDLTADLVIDELGRRGVPVARVDPADFPESLTMSAHIHESRWNGPIVSSDGVSLDVQQVRSVYYRRPGLPTFPAGMSEAEREWATREAIHGVYGVLGALDCLYVNHPARNYAAELKAQQLAVAVRCGLEVPATLVTNDPEDARRFVKDTQAVVKPLRGGAIVEHGRRKAAFTHMIDVGDIDDSLRMTTHLLQEWVDKTHEVRVVVVGEQLFAAEIHPGSPAARVDFRADYASLAYRATPVPTHVTAGIHALMDRLGLVFAALDFAIRGDGNWVFLGDVNPNGQWAWIEGHLPELRITAALADVLQRGSA